MAAIIKESIGFEAVITEVELTGTGDTLDVKSGNLFLRNSTASSVTIGILGDEVSAETLCNGVGNVDTSTPYEVTVGANELVTVPLSKIEAYLAGTVAVTGGATGVFAYVL